MLSLSTHRAFLILKAVRLPNLLLLIAGQWAMAYVLIIPAPIRQLARDPYWLVLNVVSVMLLAGIYLFSSLKNRRMRLALPPSKMIVGVTMSTRWAILYSIGLAASSLVFAGLYGWKLALLTALVWLLSFVYVHYLRHSHWAGQLLNSWLLLLLLLLPWLHFERLTAGALFIWGGAFLLNLIKTIIDDLAMHQYRELLGIPSLSQRIGWLQTKRYLMVVIACFIAYLFMGSGYLSSPMAFYYLCLLLPFSYFVFRLALADQSKQLNELSNLVKLFMAAGLGGVTLL